MEQAGHDRALLKAKALGDFAIGEFLGVPEGQNLAVVLREGLKRPGIQLGVLRLLSILHRMGVLVDELIVRLFYTTPSLRD